MNLQPFSTDLVLVLYRKCMPLPCFPHSFIGHAVAVALLSLLFCCHCFTIFGVALTKYHSRTEPYTNPSQPYMGVGWGDGDREAQL